MAQDYKVLQFKKGDFQDNFGNYWCDMALEGEGEPVRIVVKDPMEYHDGMTLYGHIEDATSKAGKPYRRFKREKKEDGYQNTTPNSGSAKAGYKTDDHTQESIARSVALKAAVDSLGTGKNVEEVIKVANEFLAWLQNSGSQGDSTPASTPATNEVQSTAPAAPNPKRPWENRKPAEQPPVTNEFSEADMPFEGDRINLDDIPF